MSRSAIASANHALPEGSDAAGHRLQTRCRIGDQRIGRHRGLEGGDPFDELAAEQQCKRPGIPRRGKRRRPADLVIDRNNDGDRRLGPPPPPYQFALDAPQRRERLFDVGVGGACGPLNHEPVGVLRIRRIDQPRGTKCLRRLDRTPDRLVQERLVPKPACRLRIDANGLVYLTKRVTEPTAFGIQQ